MSSSSAHSFVPHHTRTDAVGLSVLITLGRPSFKASAPSGGHCLGRKYFHSSTALFLTKEAPQKRNNLLEFLWFGKISHCSQLLEESLSEIFPGLPAACNCSVLCCISRDAWRLLRVVWTRLRTFVQAQVSSKAFLCSVTLSHVQLSPSHPGQEKSQGRLQQSWQLLLASASWRPQESNGFSYATLPGSIASIELEGSHVECC